MRGLLIGAALAAVLGAGVAFAQSSPATPASTADTPAPAKAQPQPTATPTYKFVWVPGSSGAAPEVTPAPGPHAPQINEIDLGDQTLVTPGELRVRVLTNRDVVSVIARTLGREIAIPRQDTGTFSLSGMVPQVPRFLSGRTFDVDFVAASADGRTETVTLSLGLE